MINSETTTLQQNNMQLFELVDKLSVEDKAYLLAYLENDIAEINNELPTWQIELGRQELQNMVNNNTVLVEWDEAKNNLKV